MSEHLRKRLTEIKSRYEATTPGPWQYLRNDSWGGNSAVGDADGHPIAFVGDPNAEGVDADATFIAHAREDLPELVGLLEHILKMADTCRERGDRLLTMLETPTYPAPPNEIASMKKQAQRWHDKAATITNCFDWASIDD